MSDNRTMEELLQAPTEGENASKTDDRIDKLADQISTLVDIFAKKVATPSPVKAVEESCVTCGGPHAHYNYDATNSNQPSVFVATGTYNQVAPQNRASDYMAPSGFAPVQNSQNRFNQNEGQRNNFNRGNNFHGNQPFQVPNQGFQSQHFQVPNNPVQQGFSNKFSSYKKANDQIMRNMQNQINSLKGTLPSNNIPNPKGEMKAITTRSGVAYEGPSIPTNPSPKKLVERETEETKDKEQTSFQGSTAHIQPPVTLIPKPDVPKILPKPNIPYPSRLNDQKLYEKATNQMEKFFQIFQDLHFDIKRSMLKKCLIFIKNSSGGNPTSTSKPILSDSSPSLTLFEGSDFILEEIEAYLKDESISLEIDHANCDPEGDICFIEKLLNNDPFQLSLMDLKQGEVVKAKSSIEEPSEVELKDLPSHLEYAYLEGVDKLPVIIAKYLKDNEKEALLKVLKSHKWAIA
nr:reverse transcriptase domain-containing protein [Tanacetum cinerariifolium]